MKTARVLDCDGTIIKKLDSTLLERFIKDYCKTQNLKKKINMAARTLAIKAYKKYSEQIGNFFGKLDITGETTSLSLFEVLMLKDLNISMNYLKEKPKEYKKFIKDDYIECFKKCEDDIYIVSAEPRQLLKPIMDELNLNGKIKEIYGTEFEIKKGEIKGFERTKLFAGIRGKYIGMERIISKRYDLIYAIGDSMADLGLFKEHKTKIIPYTFEDSPEELKEYVEQNGGKVVKSLDEFFEDSM